MWQLILFGLDSSCGTTICRSRGGVFYVKMVEMFKKVTGAAHVHVFHHRLRVAKDNADGNGFNSSVQPYAVAVHIDSSWHAAEKAFLWFAENAVDAKFCKGRFVYINAWRNITTDPIENNRCLSTRLFMSPLCRSSEFQVPSWRRQPCSGVLTASCGMKLAHR